jgi:tRNA-2-methylthio-N6-dimethylallyladenosine synthase
MSSSVYIETLGCQMNVADTERAATRLRAAGYQLTDTPDSAEVIIFNTCSVRERAAQKVYTRIGEVRKSRGGARPIIGVMGCVAQLEGESIFERSPMVDLVIGTRATDRLPALLERAKSGQRKNFDLGERADGETWSVAARERRSPYIAFVPIIEGCNKFCSYCIVPYSRGREKSRPPLEIIEEVRRLGQEGFREIHLIGQNVNSYRPKTDVGLEKHRGATPFSRLLRGVAATGMERIKFTTSFPRDFHTDIVTAIDEHKNLCDWIHLPVQSGNDRVLKAMRRGYKREDYLRRIEVIKNARRKLSLTSDIIVGFPGETAAEFEDTLSLVEQCQYDGLYLFKYSERPGTPAANLFNDVSRDEKARRFQALEELQRKIQRRIYDEYIGREVKVLVEKESAKSQEDMVGHSTCHKVINFPGKPELKGQVVNVQVIEAKVNSLYGAAL